MTAESQPLEQLDRVRTQFARQAQVYADTDQARDLRAMRRLVRVMRPSPDARVLDVACGPGRLTRVFAGRCREAVGIDATDAMLQIARIEAEASGIDNVRFESGDARQLPYADGSFDVVACRGAFHHFDAPQRVLQEMVRVVVPGGQLLVADMLGNDDAQAAQEQDALERLCDPTHVRALSMAAFRELFAAAGLQLERSATTELTHSAAVWLQHGGPDPAAATEARRRLALWAGGVNPTLTVRGGGAGLHIVHRTGIFVLRAPR